MSSTFRCTSYQGLLVMVYFLLFVICCQYQCKWLPGKTRLWNDLLCVEQYVKTRTHSLQISWWVWQWKNFESWSIFDEVVRKIWWSTFLFILQHPVVLVQTKNTGLALKKTVFFNLPVRSDLLIYLNVKGKGRCSSSWEPHLRAMGRQLPYRITQCYLPPDTSKHTPPNPSQAGCYSIYLPWRDGSGRLSWPSWLESAPAGSWTSDLSIASLSPTTAPPRHEDLWTLDVQVNVNVGVTDGWDAGWQSVVHGAVIDVIVNSHS